MAVEATFSKFKLKNYKIYIAVCVVVAVILAYDGYLSKYEWSQRHKFYQDHVVDNDGKPDTSMVINQRVPFVCLIGVGILATMIVIQKKRKLVADDYGLTVDGLTIAYDSIEKIDKTFFDKKGYFDLTYEESRVTKEIRLSDRTYDNLGAVLDEVVAKISR